MKTVLSSFFFSSLLVFFSLSVFAEDVDTECIACHAAKDSRLPVYQRVLDQSVHKGIKCRECHIDVTAFPHITVGRVNCGICHFLGRKGAPREQALEYKMSVHGASVRLGRKEAPSCQTCHGSHEILPSSNPQSNTYKIRVPELCSRCHPGEFDLYRQSVHGVRLLEKRDFLVASCFDCHQEHATPSVDDPAWKLGLVRQCGSCHPGQMETYRKTFHGKVTRLGYETMAKCPDCHGSHNILSVSDRDSTLSPRNRLATCRGCHPNATEGFTKYYAHAEETDRRQYPELFWTYVFMTALLIGVFGFFFAHTFLWAFRSLKERVRGRGGK